MTLSRRKTLSALTAITLGPLHWPARSADEYPSRTVRIVCGFAPGGAADTASRLMAEHLTRRLGRSVIVENRVGASGNLGAQHVAGADADGHTLLLAYDGTLVINPFVFEKVPFDTRKDFAPIGKIGDIGLLIVSNPKTHIKTMDDMVALSRTAAGLSVGTAGAGSTSHLLLEMLKKRTGANLVHIPYKGANPATAAVIGGELPLAIVGVTGMQQHVQSGAVRPIALSNTQRSGLLPDVATLGEIGMSDLIVTSWNGLVAPARTPSAVIQRLSTELNAILRDSAVRMKLDGMGFTGTSTSPAGFADQIRNDIERLGPVIKAAGIKAA